MSERPRMIERARPLLGTVVSTRVEAYDPGVAHRAIDAAFEQVALIHQLMSFHLASSDVSRLNREAALRAVQVHAHTWRVLRWAQTVAAASAGCFDITIAGRLVEGGELPRPSDSMEDQRARQRGHARWQDVQLLPDHRVRFRQALWIDLGGIAKGYAVDCAMVSLRRAGIRNAVVNAGGDLRSMGSGRQLVTLRIDTALADDPVPQLLVGRTAVATSCAGVASAAGVPHRVHLHGCDGTPVAAGTTVSVIASRCVVADALTKVVLAQPRSAAPLLRRFGACAYRLDASGWHSVGARPRYPVARHPTTCALGAM